MGEGEEIVIDDEIIKKYNLSIKCKGKVLANQGAFDYWYKNQYMPKKTIQKERADSIVDAKKEKIKKVITCSQEFLDKHQFHRNKKVFCLVRFPTLKDYKEYVEYVINNYLLYNAEEPETPHHLDENGDDSIVDDW